MSSMDYRMAARRLAVREVVARTRLRWLLFLVGFVLVSGVGLAAARSDLLAVKTIELHGSVHSGAAQILDSAGLVTGIPTISVRPGRIEAALEADPWVARADVRVVWPGSIEVTVLEHVPAGWIRSGNRWLQVAAGGQVLAVGEPPKRAAVVKGGDVSARPGDVIEERSVLAGLELLALLPPELRRKAEVRTGGASLVAIIRGHRVDLGTPDDIREKTAALVAVFADGVADDARISVVAPTRPAVLVPKRKVEDAGKDEGGKDKAGKDKAGKDKDKAGAEADDAPLDG